MNNDPTRLLRKEQMLETATQVASNILASLSEIEVLDHFADAARQLTGARDATIGVATKEGDRLEAFVRWTVFTLGVHLAVAIRNLQMLKRQRALGSGLIAAQEEERRAVANDLHDGLKQYVMAAQMPCPFFEARWSEAR